MSSWTTAARQNSGRVRYRCCLPATTAGSWATSQSSSLTSAGWWTTPSGHELSRAGPPPRTTNQALHLTGAARLVARDIKPLQRPRQVSLVVGCLFMRTALYMGRGSGTGPILLSQATFLLAHIANNGPVPLPASSRFPLSPPPSRFLRPRFLRSRPVEDRSGKRKRDRSDIARPAFSAPGIRPSS